MTTVGTNHVPQAATRAVMLERLREHVDVVRDLASQADTMATIAEVLSAALFAGKKVLAFGNGGSAADAEHFVGELLGRYMSDRPPLPAVALTTASPTLTAIANDYDYGQVFARQVEALGQPGDVVVGISTSGRSPNVIEAMRVAKQRGLVTVALTGAAGLQMSGGPDYCLTVPSTITPRIQEAHIVAIHCICEFIEHERVRRAREPLT